MFCGTRSFSQIDGSGDKSPTSKKKFKQLSSSSSSSRQQHKGSRKHTKNNPYSSTGLDKFEKVLAELEAKKESILSRTKSQGGEATVRFTYRSETEDWIPIIIKRREEKTDDEGETKTTRAKGVVAKRLSAPPSFRIEKGLEDDDQVVMKKRKGKKKKKKKMKSRCYYYSWGGGRYWALVMVLVLVALIFGRSFAICWTTMWWYMVPMVKERMGINLRRKELRKRLSENKLGGHEGHAN